MGTGSEYVDRITQPDNKWSSNLLLVNEEEALEVIVSQVQLTLEQWTGMSKTHI